MPAVVDRIDIDRLQPASAREELRRRQREDARRRIDPATGLLRADLSTPTACHVCGADAPRELFRKEGFRYVECTRCGLWYVNPRLNDEETAALYAPGGRGHFQFEQFYLPSAEYRMETFYHDRLEAIELRLDRRGRILDVGSSTGHFLLCAKDRGWEVHGVELADYAARYAREELDLPTVRCVDLLKADYPPGYFDAITLWDVIEHVTAPKPLMARVRELLVDDGMVFMHTPNAHCFEGDVLGPDAINLAGDFHPACYTRRSLRELVETSGLAVCELFSFGLDVAHIIDVYMDQGRRDEAAYYREQGNDLQRSIDADDNGCYLACYARRY